MQQDQTKDTTSSTPNSVNVLYAKGATIASYVPAKLEIKGQNVQLVSSKDGEEQGVIFNVAASEIDKVSFNGNLKSMFKTKDGKYNVKFNKYSEMKSWSAVMKGLGIKAKNYAWISIVVVAFVAVLLVWLVFFNK